jgi:Rhodopirellula transposase DDE domain
VTPNARPAVWSTSWNNWATPSPSPPPPHRRPPLVGSSGAARPADACPTACRSHRISPQIEHRLFSHISTNWRGRPLVSHEVIVELIGATTTRSGLRVHAELDRGSYPLGIKVSKPELAAVPLRRHDWHGEWNYTVLPTAA